MDLLRGHVASASGASDAAPLLRKAARRLERLDLGLARETYLNAWAAAVYAGHIARSDELLEICRAAVHTFADMGCDVEEASPNIPGTDQVFLGTIVPRLLVQFDQELPANYQELIDPAANAFLPLGMGMSARDAYGAVYGDYAIHDLSVSFFQTRSISPS